MPQAHDSFISPGKALPEMTLKAVLLGSLLAVVMGAANAYLGLYAGMTVAASIPAAVISMAVLRSLLRAGLVRQVNILENNIVQTIASAGEALAAAVIFTFPALIILGIWKELDYWTTTVAAVLGGTLGVLFSVSLRRLYIVEQDLPYPEGAACAEVLIAGERGGSAVKLLGAAFGLSALFKMATRVETGDGRVASLGLWRETIGGTADAGGTKFAFGAAFSPALLGVGYIVGPRIAAMVFAGGVIGGLIALPVVSSTTPADFPFRIMDRVRFLGVGTMVVGGLWTLWTMRSAITRGAGEALKGMRGSGASGPAPLRTERDIPPSRAMLGGLLLGVPIGGVFYALTGSAVIAAICVVVMGVAAYIFSAISGYIAGILGSSNNPLSGMTIIALLFTAVFLAVLGLSGVSGMAAVIGVAAVVAAATSIAGDNLQDLKTGWIVGATPYWQQIALIIGVASSALLVAPVVNILNTVYGIGKGLPAPQAFLMAAITRGVFTGTMDIAMVGAGAALGIGLIVASRFLKVKISVMAVAVGIYLPVYLSTPIMLGGLVRWFVERSANRAAGPSPPKAEFETFKETMHGKGVLFASGLIAGEALMGVMLAALVVGGLNIAVVSSAMEWPGLIVFLYLALLTGYVGWRELEGEGFRGRFGGVR